MGAGVGDSVLGDHVVESKLCVVGDHVIVGDHVGGSVCADT